MCLEGFQSGLAWITILRKREAFRAAFAGFDPERVARFDERDVERLLGDAGIVRHRGKIEATIANARATLALRETDTPLERLMWEYRDARRRRRALEAPEEGRLPLRRPDDGLRGDAGDGDRQRSRPGLLGARRGRSERR